MAANLTPTNSQSKNDPWIRDQTDANDVEKYSALRSLTMNIAVGSFWYDTVDLSKLPSHITEITLWAGTYKALDVGSLSTIAKLEKLRFLRFYIYKNGMFDSETFCKMYSPFNDSPPILLNPTFIHLSSIRVLEFSSCELDTLDWLPPQVEELWLGGCSLRKTLKTEKNFSLKPLNTIKQITIERCKIFFSAEFPTEGNRVESLRIWNHNPRLTDDTFKNFPQSLKEFSINSSDITDVTIGKLGIGVQLLCLNDCPKINAERVKLLFPESKFEGMIQQNSITDEFRQKLEQAVIGQPQAINAALKALCVSLSGLTPSDRPSGVFLFVGTSGVGKTELAKAIASVGNRYFLRYDMAEYQLEHEVAKLVGSPPGYKGNSAGSKLINDVKQHPNAVVLFDEIEKANSAVHKILLGVFDAGRLTDGKGSTADFTKTIIIMTSNLGAMEIARLNWDNVEQALEKSKSIVLELLKHNVAPEFAGRIDTVVPFKPLEEEDIRNIMKSKIQRYEKDTKQKHNIQLEISESVWLPLLKNMDLTLGARPIIRQLEQEINAEIGKQLLNGSVKKGDKLQVFREKEKILLKLIRTN